MATMLRKLQLAGHLVLLLSVSLFLWQGTASASGGIAPEDPMVKITSAPTDLDVVSVLAAVGKDVSKATGISESFITYYWQTFDAIVYEGKKANRPLFVDLHVPSFFSDDDVQGMLGRLGGRT